MKCLSMGDKASRWRHLFRDEHFLFFFSYGLFLLISILSTSFYYKYIMGPFFVISQAICVALLILHEYRQGKKTQNLHVLILFGIFFLISLQVTEGNLTRLVPMMFLYFYGARNIHFAKIARFSLFVTSTVVMFVVFSGYLGIIDNVVVAKGVRIREYLGFRYALYLPGMLLNITALWIYLYKDKVPISGSVFLAAINLFVYIKTDSRISCALALMLLVIGIVLRFIQRILDKMQWIWALLSGSYILFAAFSYVFTAIYNSSTAWLRRLNSMLESRLSLGKRSLENYGVKIFGQRISWVGNGLDADGNTSSLPYTYVDSLYIKVLQRYGALFTVLAIALCTRAMNRIRKQKEYLLLIICASVAAHCVLDDLSLGLHYNTFWFALALALLNPSALKWNSISS